MINHLLKCLALVAGLLGASHALAADAPPPPKTGDALCTKCHDETESYPVLAIAKTRHGVKADKRTPTCQGCHGESPTHTNKPEGVKVRPGAEVGYGPKVKAPVEKQNQMCVNCHQSRKLIHWQGSAHSTRDVACTSCHTMHAQHDKVMVKKSQPDVCYQCHKEQRALFARQSHHPVPEAKLACSDCHASHGTLGVKSLIRDSVADTCFTCHAEKRGPFVRTHQPAEDCSICHNPHGTSVDNLLKTRPPFLCQQCHEPNAGASNAHRGNVPGFGAANASLYNQINITAGRSCLNCHTNIHGTNNPSSANSGRSLRR